MFSFFRSSPSQQLHEKPNAVAQRWAISAIRSNAGSKGIKRRTDGQISERKWERRRECELGFRLDAAQCAAGVKKFTSIDAVGQRVRQESDIHAMLECSSQNRWPGCVRRGRRGKREREREREREAATWYERES